MFAFLDQRPIIIALAGSNGAGKSTFFDAFLKDSGLRFVNADTIASACSLPAMDAAEIANAIRRELVHQRESFIFETVLSDPEGRKVSELAACRSLGYTVVLIFIRIDTADDSLQRVAMRVSQGGHDVPDDKLAARFPRTRKNLERAIAQLPHVLVFDNQDLTNPFRLVERFEDGTRRFP